MDKLSLPAASAGFPADSSTGFFTDPVVEKLIAALRAGVPISMDVAEFARRRKWSTRQVRLLAERKGLPVRHVPGVGEAGAQQARVFLHDYIAWAMTLPIPVRGTHGWRPNKRHLVLEVVMGAAQNTGPNVARTDAVQALGNPEKVETAA
jgi:hypothetical protein